MSLNFKDKKVLFFCPKTFNYEHEILEKLKDGGAKVSFRSAQPLEYSWFKALIRVLPFIGWVIADFVYFLWLKKYSPPETDFVFIIKGEGLSPRFLKAIKRKYNKAKFILYLWDSVANVTKTEQKLPYFDKVFSFDPNDCKKYPDFIYRPLFFLDKYLNPQNTIQGKKLFFIGTLNGDRPKVISRLLGKLPDDIDFDYWLFVRSRFELFFRRIFEIELRNLDCSRLIFLPMSSKEIQMRYEQCTAVLDVEHPNQTGLTMRTFEVVASGRKLVTTNASILNQDFYDPIRIAVIDRNKPDLPDDFFSTRAPVLTKEFKFKYSINGWLADIFAEE